MYTTILDVPVERILSFNDVSVQFQRLLLDKGNEEVQLPASRGHPRPPYHVWYAKESVELVAEIWKRDIDQFGFTF